MRKDPNQAAHEFNDGRRDKLVETFGSDILIGLPTDPPLGQAPTRSALFYEERRRKAVRAARIAQARKTAMAAAQLDQDERAYQRVMDKAQADDKVTPADLEAADRHIQRNNLVQPQTSAEKLARS
jgi:hypothetical protein